MYHIEEFGSRCCYNVARKAISHHNILFGRFESKVLDQILEMLCILFCFGIIRGPAESRGVCLAVMAWILLNGGKKGGSKFREEHGWYVVDTGLMPVGSYIYRGYCRLNCCRDV